MARLPDDDEKLVAHGLGLADLLDASGSRLGGGVVRQLAARVTELRHQLDAGMGAMDGRCKWCRGPIVQPVTGRRRTRCAACSPPRRRAA